MAAPTILSTYPNDNDTGIPIGISIEVQFDRGVDLQTARSAIVVYGTDFDQTSGPGQAQWVDQDTGDNPFFLSSPGFQGIVPLNYSLVYYDLDSNTQVDPGTITSEADELAYGVAGVGHRLIATPQEQLSADLQYNIFVLGDPDTVGNGVSSRTVFDVEPDPGNTSTTGVMHNYGGYTGTLSDRVIVEITTGGNIGTAQYRWYYQSAGVGSAVTGKITARRYRKLDDGLQIRFDGSAFVAGDFYRFNVEPIERMTTNTQLSFTTNDGSFTTPPSSPSTPATSSPPATILPPVGGGSPSGTVPFDVTGMLPADRSFNVDLDTRQIIITFTEDVDPATVTDSTVTLYLVSALGQYADTMTPQELSKNLTVSGNTITIDF